MTIHLLQVADRRVDLLSDTLLVTSDGRQPYNFQYKPLLVPTELAVIADCGPLISGLIETDLLHVALEDGIADAIPTIGKRIAGTKAKFNAGGAPFEFEAFVAGWSRSAGKFRGWYLDAGGEAAELPPGIYATITLRGGDTPATAPLAEGTLTPSKLADVALTAAAAHHVHSDGICAGGDLWHTCIRPGEGIALNRIKRLEGYDRFRAAILARRLTPKDPNVDE